MSSIQGSQNTPFQPLVRSNSSPAILPSQASPPPPPPAPTGPSASVQATVNTSQQQTASAASLTSAAVVSSVGDQAANVPQVQASASALASALPATALSQSITQAAAPSAPPLDRQDSSIPPAPPLARQDSSIPPAPPLARQDSSIPPAPPLDRQDSSIPPAPPLARQDSSIPPAPPLVRQDSSIPPAPPGPPPPLTPLPPIAPLPGQQQAPVQPPTVQPPPVVRSGDREAIDDAKVSVREGVVDLTDAYMGGMVRGTGVIAPGSDNLDDAARAVRGQGPVIEPGADRTPSSHEYGVGAVGVLTNTVGVAKALYDTGKAAKDVHEASQKVGAARVDIEAGTAKISRANQLADPTILSGDALSQAVTDTVAKRPQGTDEQAFRALVTQAFDPAGRANVSPEDLGRVNTAKASAIQELRSQGEQQWLQGEAHLKLAKADRLQASLELSKGLATSTSKTAGMAGNIASMTTSVTREVVGAQAQAVAGVAGMVVSAGECVYDIYRACQASGLQESMTDLREPSAAGLDRAATRIEARASDLQKKAQSAREGGWFSKPNPTRAAELDKQANELMVQAGKIRLVSAEFTTAADKPADLAALQAKHKLQDEGIDAIATQVQKRVGLKHKIFSAIKNAVAVGAGIAMTVALFAGAAAVAATPVGWALAGAAAVVGIGLGVYKLAKIHSRNKECANISNQLQAVHQQIHANPAPTGQALTDLQDQQKSLETRQLRRDPSAAIDKLKSVLRNPPEPVAPGTQPTPKQQEYADATRLLRDGLGQDISRLQAMDDNHLNKALKRYIKVF